MNIPAASPDARFLPVRRSRTFRRILDAHRLREKKVLDLGCGYGEYLVHFGAGSIGVTTTPAEVSYGQSHTIPIVPGNVEFIDELSLGGGFEAFWANNLFEHLLSPHAFLMQLKTIATDDAVIVLGVPVVPRIVALMRMRKFRGALAIAHINFWTRDTLSLTVERAGWHVAEARPYIFSNALADWCAGFFAPHVYVVARNNARFAYHPKKLKEWEHDPHYHRLLDIAKK